MDKSAEGVIVWSTTSRESTFMKHAPACMTGQELLLVLYKVYKIPLNVCVHVHVYGN